MEAVLNWLANFKRVNIVLYIVFYLGFQRLYRNNLKQTIDHNAGNHQYK